MAKNMTRRGLALGAGIALVATGLVASPAYAADLSLVPGSGPSTGTSVLLSDSFTLHTAVTGSTNIANTAALKYEIVNTTDATLVNTAEYWNTDVSNDGDTTLPSVVGESAYTTATPTTTGTTTQIVSVVDTTQTIGKVNKLTINPTTTLTSTTFSVTVRSFSDLDSSGTVSAGDLVSDAVTITFHKSSDLTVTTTLGAIVTGVAPVATLSVAPAAFNLEMTAIGNFNGTFSVDGATATNGTEALNTAKDAILSTSGVLAAAGTVITAQAQAKSYDGSALADIGSSIASTTPAASTATTVKAAISNSANIKASAVNPTGANTVEISKELRSGTAAIDYTMSFRTATAAVGAGVPVSIVASELTDQLVVGEFMTINGKKITGTVGLDTVTVNTLTDANGQVTVSVTAANAKVGEHIEIIATSNTATVGVYFEWVTAAIDNVYVTNNNPGDTDRTVVKGASTTIEYIVVDQFKQAWTRTDYNYRLVFTNSGTATNPQPLVLSNGTGTQVWADTTTAATGLYSIVATLQDQTLVGAWTGTGHNVTSSVNVVASAPAPSAVTVATAVKDQAGTALAASGVPLALVDLAALDNRVDNNTVASLGVAADDGAELVATVTAANGGNVKGAAVTISAAGVYFSTSIGGSGVVAKDSITLNTATNGRVIVFAYSNTAGKKTITYTSGSVTKTQDVTWAAAAADTGDALTISAAASAMPGTTFKVTGKLVDEYGNGVQIATAGIGANPTLVVGYAGPGLVSGSLPTTTSAAGEFSFYVLLGANDSGSAVVTASYDADGTAVTLSAIAASATVVVGTAGNVGVLASWTKNLNDGTVKMYAKNIVGAGKVQFMLNGEEIAWVRATSAADSKLRNANGASYLVRTIDLVEGQKNVLEILVDGVRSARSAYSY